jgi:moderate conductance mechanosensitive channel
MPIELQSFLNILNAYGLSTWLQDWGVRIIIILLFAFLARLIATFFVEQIFLKAIRNRHETQVSRRRRAETVAQLISSAVTAVIMLIALLTILSVFDINVGPLLAGAGFVGVALVVSAQQLIKDLVSGFLIISENQYKIGDYVCLGESCGIVKDITLRLTVLQDLDGAIHYMPNSSFTHASNHSIDYTRIGLKLGIKNDENLEQAIKVVNEVGKELAADPEWRDIVLEPPYFSMIMDFVGEATILKVTGKIKPLAHLKVESELRKRIKFAFDRKKITILQPQ